MCNTKGSDKLEWDIGGYVIGGGVKGIVALIISLGVGCDHLGTISHYRL